jgi:hypothetical protein
MADILKHVKSLHLLCYKASYIICMIFECKVKSHINVFCSPTWWPVFQVKVLKLLWQPHCMSISCHTNRKIHNNMNKFNFTRWNLYVQGDNINVSCRTHECLMSYYMGIRGTWKFCYLTHFFCISNVQIGIKTIYWNRNYRYWLCNLSPCKYDSFLVKLVQKRAPFM